MTLYIPARQLREGDKVHAFNSVDVVSHVMVGYDGLCRIEYYSGRKTYCDNSDIIKINRGEK